MKYDYQKSIEGVPPRTTNLDNVMSRFVVLGGVRLSFFYEGSIRAPAMVK